MRYRLAFGTLFLAFLRTAPLCAQLDLSGDWTAKIHEDQTFRIPGPSLGEYQGLPLNDAARLKADSWDASINGDPARQCIPFGADLQYEIDSTQIWKETDPDTNEVIAWHNRVRFMNQMRTWWMDGRPHPGELAAHTWAGFSTGKWEGNILTVTTTHLKAALIERNGVLRSDKATLVEHYIRHGDNLTVVQVTVDPVYLTEPLIRTKDFVLNVAQRMTGYTCRPAEEIAKRPPGYVAHHLPGTNTMLQESAIEHHVPLQAERGGAETMYPEYILKLKTMPIPAERGK